MPKNKKDLTKKTGTAKAAPAKATPMKQTTKATPAKTVKEMLAKPAAKSTKKPEPKVKLAVVSGKKGDKKSEKLEVVAIEVAVQATEEEEEELETAQANNAGAAEAGLALAAATANADTAAGSLKNFRHHPDIENFYRFIYENDLRYEALEIIDVIVSQRGTTKAVKVAKAKAH